MGAVADGGSHAGSYAMNTYELTNVDSPFKVYEFDEDLDSSTLKKECEISDE
jgi:hypothetical protein